MGIMDEKKTYILDGSEFSSLKEFAQHWSTTNNRQECGKVSRTVAQVLKSGDYTHNPAQPGTAGEEVFVSPGLLRATMPS